MFPLTGNGELDKDLAKQHERELLEEAEAEAVAKGEAKEGDYQPVSDNGEQLIEAPKRNKHIKHNDK